MKPHALTTTLCLAALAAACPTVDRASNRIVSTLAAPALPTPAHPST